VWGEWRVEDWWLRWLLLVAAPVACIVTQHSFYIYNSIAFEYLINYLLFISLALMAEFATAPTGGAKKGGGKKGETAEPAPRFGRVKSNLKMGVLGLPNVGNNNMYICVFQFTYQTY
jgi:hypothetical protein